ncbi:hypothetical protein U2G91_26455 (plasmid) [Rhodococcoides fascians]|uniref:hypothetical protein n=1 Tax=Nocardiaceae TaxID=85025 RepID=UPI001AE16000|nr:MULTISPECIES: hypothetical protein [Rhodococcus]MBP2527428.1 hypothetical protein [Rhodococcus sp. PvP104]WQH31350.1 hypothetical protein U2G91_26455 [Rhodococcus fascians]
MARVKQTVVAVVHGNDDGRGVDVEVYPYATESATGRRAQQLLQSWRPQPGELDDSSRVGRRIHALQTAPGHSRNPQDRAAMGFLTRAVEPDLAWARAMSGSTNAPVYDAGYEYEVGEVLLFDAEVDTERLEIDWSTAVPHPSTSPETIPYSGQVERVDGIVIDPEACRERRHLVTMTDEGTLCPFNEAGQLVVGLSDEEKHDYEIADRSQIPHRGPLLVTVDFGRPVGANPRLRAEPADAAIGRGALDRLEPTDGVRFRPADLEALRLAAGDQQVHITDPTGATVGAVYLVEADYGTELVNGSVIFDGLGASNAADSGLRVNMSGVRFANHAQAVGDTTRGSAFLGGSVSSSRRQGAGAVYSHTTIGGREESLESALDLASPNRTADSKSGGRKALAAVQSRTASLVRAHGPTVVAATRSKLKDPAVQAVLRNTLMTAVEIGLAGKGGSSMRIAQAASTAMRVGDMVATAQTKHGGSSAGLSR